MFSDEKFNIHYKNKPYRYLGIAKHSETLEDVVVYECLYENKTAKLWVRPRQMFEGTTEVNGKIVPRFRQASRQETLQLSQKMYDEKPHSVVLEPMRGEEFAAYRTHSIQHYAQNKVRAGNWTATESLERSEKEFDLLLPQGLKTPNHCLFNAIDTATHQRVGIAWIHVRPEHKTVFVYDFLVEEPYRGKGLGRILLRLVEKRALAFGAEKLALHVFGFNTAARALYESAGFETTNVSMQKNLT